MERQFTCNRCDKSFDRAWKLARHERTHEVSTSCTVCDRECGSLPNLTRHRRTHDIAHVCRVCSKNFSTARNLRRHFRVVHPDEEAIDQPTVVNQGPAEAGPSRGLDPGAGGAGRAGGGEGRGGARHGGARPGGNGLAGPCSAGTTPAVQARLGAGRGYFCIFCRKRCHTFVELRLHRRTECNRVQPSRRPQFRCPRCHVASFNSRGARDAHVGGCGLRGRGRFSQPSRGRPKLVWAVRASLDGSGTLHDLPLRANSYDLNLALIEHKQRLIERLDWILGRERGIRWYLSATVVVTREKPEANSGTAVELKVVDKVVRSLPFILTPVGLGNITTQLEAAILQVVHQSEHLSIDGSNWCITRVKSLQLAAAAYEPLDASGGGYIPTPKCFRSSQKGVVNIKTHELDCFELSVAAGRMPRKRNPNRPQIYRPHVQRLMNCGDLAMRPMCLDDIREFQDLNPEFSLSVIGATEDKEPKLYPLIAPRRRLAEHISLLLLTDGEKRHYCLIRDLSSFLADQTKHKARMEVCVYCLSRHTTVQLRECHESLCQQHGAQKTVYAAEGDVLEFKAADYKTMVRPHNVIYYHFEYAERLLTEDDPRRHAGPDTTRIIEHIPMAYILIVINHEGEATRTIRHSGPEGRDITEHFIDNLLALEDELFESRVYYPLHMTDLQTRMADLATTCWLCGESVDPEERVMDHCHITPPPGNFLGLAHRTPCNVKRSTPNFLPVVAMSAGKTHINAIISALPPYIINDGAVKGVKIIARGAGDYMGAILELRNKRRVRLIDCHQFYDSDISELRYSALKAPQLPIFDKFYPDAEQAHLMKSGLVVPVEAPASYNDLIQQQTFPAREAMVCPHQIKPISESQYQDAQRIWQKFGCSNMMDYIEEQTFCNVVALAEFFEKFRGQIFKQYQIDVLHFFSTSGMIWTAMLKTTKVKLDLISDPTLYLFWEISLKGGVNFVSKKLSTANSPGTSTFDPDQPHKHILGFDICNMYASIIEDEKLPCSEFKWISGARLSDIDWLNWDADGDIGFTVMVDLIYPRELWERDDEYPLAPEKISVPAAWWSDAQRHLAALCEISEADRPQKLISHLGPRQQYVLHGKSLQYMLKRGLVVAQFHIGVQYKQSNYMSEFMRDLTTQRREATDPCTEKSLKRRICCLFGRATRQPRRDRNHTIETNMKRFKKKVATPWFVGFDILGRDVVALEMKKKSVAFGRTGIYWCFHTVLV